jgi:ubiquinone/menaquinone biosynthesis C-methylase UbiE
MAGNELGEYYDREDSDRMSIVRRFHKLRHRDFAEWIEASGENVLSVGCSSGEFETTYLTDSFREIHGIDVDCTALQKAAKRGINVINQATPPIPISDEEMDAVVVFGTIEHIPKEQAFLQETERVLKPDGELYVTVPIEVGIGGLIRFLGKNFAHPERSDTPNGWRRYFGYTWEELRKETDRQKHGVSHRYYNYKYTIRDIRRIYDTVSITPWPLNWASR